jgi:hypothetical protein
MPEFRRVRFSGRNPRIIKRRTLTVVASAEADPTNSIAGSTRKPITPSNLYHIPADFRFRFVFHETYNACGLIA